MNEANAEREWRVLSTAADIEELMYLFGNFHDGCVREIHAATGHYVDRNLSMSVDWRTTVRMLIQRQLSNPSAVELRFDEVVALRLSPPPPDHVAIIFHAAFFIRDDVFYWAENADWTPETPEDGGTTWIAARRVAWRDASHWLGPTLRYLSASRP